MDLLLWLWKALRWALRVVHVYLKSWPLFAKSPPGAIQLPLCRQAAAMWHTSRLHNCYVNTVDFFLQVVAAAIYFLTIDIQHS